MIMNNALNMKIKILINIILISAKMILNKWIYNKIIAKKRQNNNMNLLNNNNKLIKMKFNVKI